MKVAMKLNMDLRNKITLLEDLVIINPEKGKESVTDCKD
jgi:hypothetical protein